MRIATRSIKTIAIIFKIEFIDTTVRSISKIFLTEYVNFLISIKEKTDKEDPKYSIILFNLNMLYGRFGMKPDKVKNFKSCPNCPKDYYSIEAEELYLNPDILINDIIDMGNGKEILRITENKNGTMVFLRRK